MIYEFPASSFLDDIISPTNNNINILQSNKISCSAKGRPLPTIFWKINNKTIEKDENNFVVTNSFEKKDLNSTSVMLIVNSIAFEKGASISCFAKTTENGVAKKKTFELNRG